MKGKFDFKELMVQRGELFALGAVVLIVAYLGYDALGYGVLKPGQGPDQLDDLVETAGRDIDKVTDPPGHELHQPDLTHVDIKLDDIDRITFQPPVFPLQKNRGQPTFFSVESPRACAGIGSFAVKAAAGASKSAGVEFRDLARDRVLRGFQGGERAAARAMRWAVITYLVPVGKQQANFDGHFADAVQPEGHKPEDDLLIFAPVDLAPPLIERAEVTTQAGAAPAWQPLSKADVIRGFQGGEDWIQAKGGQAKQNDPLAIDPKFVGIFASPLPPLLLADWPEACVLHPEITKLHGEKIDEKQPEKVDEGKPDDGQVFGRPPAKQAAPAAKKVEGATAVTHQLFRFFDFTVQPGKTYVYRVKLFMRNPNFRIDPQFLAPKAAQVKQALGRFSDDWSQPTGPVTVPIASGVFAGVLKRRTPGDDRARMMVIDRDPITGLEGHKEMTRRVGHLARFPLEMDVVLREAWWEDPDAPGVRQPRKRAGYKLVGEVLVLDPLLKKIRVDRTFISDVALLDVRGGTDGQPDEILVMDAQGNLSAHHSGDDAADFGRRNALVTAEGAAETGPDDGPGRFKNQPADDAGRSFRNRSEP